MCPRTTGSESMDCGAIPPGRIRSVQPERSTIKFESWCRGHMPELKRPPIRFGIFEVDLQAGELRRRGLKVKLQQQPFQILAMLLECPGEVVTREEIQKRLWPTDTFVDFDRGLNRATNRLRESLGDEADSPRFIETLPRRGYRFIAPVAKWDESGHVAELVPPQADA